MCTNPKISVVMPVYNVEKYLGKCIESVLNQSYKNLQVIIVEDNSTDNSREVCIEYSKKDDRILLITQEKFGVSRARNVALENATGEYIAFVDSDDWLEENAFEKMLNNILENDVDVCFCGYYKEFSDKRISVSPLKVGVCNLYTAYEQTIVRGSYQSMLWNKLFKKELIFDDGKKILFDESLTNGEDGLWTQMVLANAKRVFLDSSELYHYRVRDDGANFNKKLNMNRMSELKAYESVNNVLDKFNIDLVKKNTARMYDKAHELRVIAYIQNAKECELIAINYMNKSKGFFYKSKDFSMIYKIHHMLMNMLIILHCPRKFLNIVKCIIEKIYGTFK